MIFLNIFIRINVLLTKYSSPSADDPHTTFMDLGLRDELELERCGPEHGFYALKFGYRSIGCEHQGSGSALMDLGRGRRGPRPGHQRPCPKCRDLGTNIKVSMPK